jgi:CDP-diacylglycerol--glycerol-3-phosphate 3-phosphatidyltransferase
MIRTSEAGLITPITDKVFAATIGRLFPDSVHPNHVTLSRLFGTPFVLYFLMSERLDVGLPLFFLVALTDWFDGALARTRGQVTEWGIRYDPLVDKLLVGTVLFLVVLRHINPYLGYALLAVEAFLVVGGWWRYRGGKAVRADRWGKAKMVAEVAGIILLLLAVRFDIDLFIELSNGVLAVALVAALISIFTRMR